MMINQDGIINPFTSLSCLPFSFIPLWALTAFYAVYFELQPQYGSQYLHSGRVINDQL